MPLPPGPDLPPLFLPPSALADDPRRTLPLHGLTFLVVEDSRFACDALRLFCQRSGARLRRTETLRAARAHLKVYRPEVLIVDLGLPDGRGEALIREAALRMPRIPVILGTSGDPGGRAACLSAGAAGFLEKPLESLAAFQRAVLRHLPDRAELANLPGLADDCPAPDPLALHDDLARAANLLAANLQSPGPDPKTAQYLAGFVSGLARSAHDTALEQAASRWRDPQGLQTLAGLVSAKLAQRPAALIAPSG
ncbi:response regulator [Rhodobacter ferrooxidans]|uniref:Response regulator receiver protein n=1 Tax=Rhodobacter ferrooxidans TaxID=371731 RepID=C8S3A2_9RHOB|nr:response regulator [Rhodobacter sp. SW2]EEW24584.1 response regulator receiver protein [Rhodobacter sp. SW2]